MSSPDPIAIVERILRERPVSPQVHDDVRQEMYLALLETPAQTEQEAYITARRALGSYVLCARSPRDIPGDADDVSDFVPTPDGYDLQPEDGAIWRTAWEGIVDRCRDIPNAESVLVELFKGRRYRELGTVLGISDHSAGETLKAVRARLGARVGYQNVVKVSALADQINYATRRQVGRTKGNIPYMWQNTTIRPRGLRSFAETPEITPGAAREHQWIADVLGQLTPEDHDTWTLYYQYGLAQRTIADLAGCAQPTVSARLRRAEARLRVLLQLPVLSEAEIEAACAVLTPIEGECLRVYWRTRSQTEAANAMGWSQGKLRHGVFRAARKLAETPGHPKVAYALGYLLDHLHVLRGTSDE